MNMLIFSLRLRSLNFCLTSRGNCHLRSVLNSSSMKTRADMEGWPFVLVVQGMIMDGLMCRKTQYESLMLVCY